MQNNEIKEIDCGINQIDCGINQIDCGMNEIECDMTEIECENKEIECNNKHVHLNTHHKSTHHTNHTSKHQIQFTSAEIFYLKSKNNKTITLENLDFIKEFLKQNLNEDSKTKNTHSNINNTHYNIKNTYYNIKNTYYITKGIELNLLNNHTDSFYCIHHIFSNLLKNEILQDFLITIIHLEFYQIKEYLFTFQITQRMFDIQNRNNSVINPTKEQNREFQSFNIFLVKYIQAIYEYDPRFVKKFLIQGKTKIRIFGCLKFFEFWMADIGRGLKMNIKLQ